MTQQSTTPLTDAFDINLEMQDLSIGHKLREWKTFARSLELSHRRPGRVARESGRQGVTPVGSGDLLGIAINDIQI